MLLWLIVLSKWGDYKNALEYGKLERATQGKIERQRDAPTLLEADKNFYIGQMDN